MSRCILLHRACVVALCLVGFVSHATAQPRRVVLLYDERTDLPGLAVLDARLVRTLTAESPVAVEVYRETMDLSRFPSKTYPLVLRDYLRAKYSDKKVDVVVAAMGPALDFVLAYGAAVFPGAPVVFCGIDRRELRERQVPQNVTGVLVQREFAPTLKLALTLHPETKHVVFVAGTSEFDRRLTDAARAEFGAEASRVRIEYLTDLALPALLDTIARLPTNSVVLYSTMFTDAAGQPFVPHDVAERISAQANAPVYAFNDQYLGRGIVGGHLYSVDAHGVAAARLALRIMAGDPPSAIPPIERSSSIDLFDWRQMRRWGIAERLLPADAIVRYRTVSTLERYRTMIIGIAGVLLLQSALIVSLLVERRNRRRAQAALGESEARAEIAGVSLGVGFWLWEPDRDRVWVSRQCARLLGFDSEAAITPAYLLEAVRPRTDGPTDDAFARAIESGVPFDGEWAVTAGTGATRWIAGAIRSNTDVDGRRHVTGALIDVTERRSAERLAAEQRRELSHLGRVAVVGELSGALAHEVNQPLAAILANANAAQRMLQDNGIHTGELHDILEDIVADDRRAGAVIRRVRGLVKKDTDDMQLLDADEVVAETLDLTRSDLVHRGVVANQVEAAVPPLVHADRVQLQQVLLNLIMNACDAMAQVPAGERVLTVSTEAQDGTVRISVRDQGSGIPPHSIDSIFDPFTTTKRHGLGLGLSICRTIVSSHGGEMGAVNNPDRGATIVVSLPLAAQTPPAFDRRAAQTADADPDGQSWVRA